MISNYKKASRLIYASATVGTINALLSFNVFTKQDWILSALSISFVVIIGLLISKEYSWSKFILLIFVLVGLSGFPYIIKDIKEYPINGILSLLITIFQIIATFIVFIKQKPSTN